MTIHCNAGMVKTTTVGDLPGYGTIWYHESGVANILSLSRVINSGYRVVYDSAGKNEFLLTKPDGNSVVFEQAAQGLFFVDVGTSGSVFMNTVADNKLNFTSRERQRADLARKLQQIIGRLSTRNFVHIVNQNLLPNCPITVADIMAAEEIYGPDIGSLKGKTVRRGADEVRPLVTTVPCSILTRYRDVTLAIDVMTVNSIPFVVSMSRYLKFGTAEMVASHKAKDLLLAVHQIKSVYAKRGFKVVTALMDGEFECLRAQLADLQITLNVTARDEHVPEAECRIRTLKERCRSIFAMLPFTMIPVRAWSLS
jgi:hypothetical protein